MFVFSIAVCSEDVVMGVAAEVVLRPERPRMDAATSLLMQQRHLLPVPTLTKHKIVNQNIQYLNIIKIMILNDFELGIPIHTSEARSGAF